MNIKSRVTTRKQNSSSMLLLSLFIPVLLSGCASSNYKRAQESYERKLYERSPQYQIDQAKAAEQRKFDAEQQRQKMRNECRNTPMAEQGFEYGSKGNDIANIKIFKEKCNDVQVTINDQLWIKNYQKGLKENYCRVQNGYYALWEVYQLRCKPMMSEQQFALAKELSNRAAQVSAIRYKIRDKQSEIRMLDDDLTRSHFNEQQKRDKRIRRQKLREDIDTLQQQERTLEQANQNLMISL